MSSLRTIAFAVAIVSSSACSSGLIANTDAGTDGTDAGSPNGSTGKSCTEDGDCGSSRLLCGFPKADACNAVGQCFDVGGVAACLAYAPGCACDGTVINVACSPLPSGYASKPLLHDGNCTSDAGSCRRRGLPERPVRLPGQRRVHGDGHVLHMPMSCATAFCRAARATARSSTWSAMAFPQAMRRSRCSGQSPAATRASDAAHNAVDEEPIAFAPAFRKKPHAHTGGGEPLVTFGWATKTRMRRTDDDSNRTTLRAWTPTVSFASASIVVTSSKLCRSARMGRRPGDDAGKGPATFAPRSSEPCAYWRTTPSRPRT